MKTNTTLLFFFTLLFSKSLFAQISFVKSQDMGTDIHYQSADGDIDGDGDLDVVISGDNGNKLWINNGKGEFSMSENSLEGYSVGIKLADLDKDGDLDLFISISEWDRGVPNKVYLNDGSGKFTSNGQELGNKASPDVELADLDGDGDLDAFVANHPTWQNNQYQNDGQNEVWFNDGTGKFTNSGQNLGNGLSTDVELGDMDDDGDIDAIVTNNDGNYNNEIWINDGKGVFTEGNTTAFNFKSSGCALGDIDGDGDLDVFFANVAANTVFINDSHANFSNSNQYLGSTRSYNAMLIDIDGDGDLDAVVANGEYTAEKTNKIYFNDSKGVFTESSTFIGNGKSYSVNCFDADNDGDKDILIINNGNNELFLNQSITSDIQTFFHNGFEVFPNPVEGVFTITLESTPGLNATAGIYNVNGKMVLQQTLNSSTSTIDLSGYPAGMYLVRLIADGVSYEEKILKE